MSKEKTTRNSGKRKQEQGSAPYRDTQPAAGGELHQIADGKHPALTTNQGVALTDNQNSLRANQRGPTLLEDFILREKITHFDHERIVHARATGVHGFFELTASLKKYTTARILTEVGEKTPVFTRISTVAGGAGSVDTPRDVRSFAVKFYTKEGNWDLVGNNVPVFFIQDAIKFPDLIHAVKMEPDCGFPQSATAHDTFWDFISLTPESMHMVMWIMSDRTLPRSLRMIEGFHSASVTETGEKGRIRAESFADHYSQARQFYLSQTAYEQAHIASALVFELSKVEHLHVRAAMVGHLRHIEEDLAKRVAAGLEFDKMPAAPAAAAPIQKMKPSPALQIIGKMKDTLRGRAIGILVADGSDGAVIKKIKKAATDAGATVKIVAQKVGGAKLADGSILAADGQLAGTPSVLFDAVAVILSDKGAKALAKEGAAIDFVRDAYGHLKAIAVDQGGRALLKKANVGQDAGVVDVSDKAAFIAAAKTRQWEREKSVRTLA